ncbi:MAG: hypothetical protein ACRCTR_01295 [Actinomycetota bacterium]
MEQRWHVETAKTIAITGDAPIAALSITAVGGNIVVASDDQEFAACVEVTDVQGHPVDVTWESTEGKLTIRHPHIRREGVVSSVRSIARHDDVMKVMVTVPRHTAVRLSTVNAGSVITGIQGDVAVRTVSGSVFVEPVCTDPGAVTARSVSGDITVQLEEGAGYRFNARNVRGQITADGRVLGSARPGPPQGEIRSGDESVRLSVTSVSGAITLTRRGNATAQMADADKPAM